MLPAIFTDRFLKECLQKRPQPAQSPAARVSRAYCGTLARGWGRGFETETEIESRLLYCVNNKT